MSLLGIDVGTTGCKALVISADGKILASAQREYDVIRPHPGQAELDSRDVWRRVKNAIREVALQTTSDPIVALCVSSMGEAMTPVSADRDILGNCFLGFDTRGGETLAKLAEIDPKTFLERSGNLVSWNYGGQKLIWRRDHQPELFERADKFLCWADLVAYLLGADAVMDYSLANRTLFLDLKQAAWSAETLNYIGMPADKLPSLAQAGTVVGTVAKPIAAELGLSPDTRIVVGTHDQCAGATGAGVIRPGQAAYSLGTYICITPAYDRIPPAEVMMKPRLNVEHHALAGLYVSFYYNLTGGALLKWFRDTLAPLEKADAIAKGLEVYDLLLAEMPAEPTDLLALPHFAPTGPPYHEENAIGIIAGLTLETTRGQFIKGLLEGVTYHFREALDLMAEAGIAIDECRVSGGGARSDAWLQIKADILGRPLARPVITETGALGAAILAGYGGGVYGSMEQAVQAMVRIDKTFEPDPVRQRIYNERMERYRLLYPFSRTLRDHEA